MNKTISIYVGMLALGWAATLACAVPSPAQPAVPTAEALPVAVSAWQDNLRLQLDVVSGTRANETSSLRVRWETQDGSTPQAPADAQIYFLLVQGKQLWFTAPMALGAAASQTWAFDKIEVRPMVAGIPTQQGLPINTAQRPWPAVAGNLDKVLLLGEKVKLKVIAARTQNGKTTVWTSSAYNITPTAPDFNQLNDGERMALLVELRDGFTRDAVTGQAANIRAVAYGSAIAPSLITLWNDKALTAEGRQWLIATIAQLQNKETLPFLIQQVEKGDRHAGIVAYKTGGWQAPELQAAIAKQIGTGRSDLVIWAALGRAEHQVAIPEDWLAALSTATEPKVRVIAAQRIPTSKRADKDALLLKMLDDQIVDIRIVVIQAAGQAGQYTPELWAKISDFSNSNLPPLAKAATEYLKRVGPATQPATQPTPQPTSRP